MTAGTLSESLLDLSGAPSLFYFFHFIQEKDRENVWFKLLEAQKEGDLIGMVFYFLKKIIILLKQF